MVTIKVSDELELLLSKNVFGNQGIGIIPNIYASRLEKLWTELNDS